MRFEFLKTFTLKQEIIFLLTRPPATKHHIFLYAKVMCHHYFSRKPGIDRHLWFSKNNSKKLLDFAQVSPKIFHQLFQGLTNIFQYFFHKAQKEFSISVFRFFKYIPLVIRKLASLFCIKLKKSVNLTKSVAIQFFSSSLRKKVTFFSKNKKASYQRSCFPCRNPFRNFKYIRTF